LTSSRMQTRTTKTVVSSSSTGLRNSGIGKYLFSSPASCSRTVHLTDLRILPIRRKGYQSYQSAKRRDQQFVFFV
jgi:hypothetical protein